MVYALGDTDEHRLGGIWTGIDAMATAQRVAMAPLRPEASYKDDANSLKRYLCPYQPQRLRWNWVEK